MGTGSGWFCKSCGAKKSYLIGGGFMDFNVPQTRERIKRGQFGEIAAHLLSDSSPLQVHTIDERAFYRCSQCEKLVAGMTIRFFAGDSFDMILPAPPEKCPECHAEFLFRDERMPLSKDEIAAYVANIMPSRCPKCGSTEIVESIMISWD